MKIPLISGWNGIGVVVRQEVNSVEFFKEDSNLESPERCHAGRHEVKKITKG